MKQTPARRRRPLRRAPCYLALEALLFSWSPPLKLELRTELELPRILDAGRIEPAAVVGRKRRVDGLNPVGVRHVVNISAQLQLVAVEFQQFREPQIDGVPHLEVITTRFDERHALGGGAVARGGARRESASQ